MLYPREIGGVPGHPGTRHEVTGKHCTRAARFAPRASPLHALFAYVDP